VLARQVRRTVSVMARELKSAEALIDMDRYRREHGDKRDELARAQSDAFWQHFSEKPLDALEFLDNQIGPLAFAEDIIWVRYIGTDTELFQKTFDRFEIVDGQMIPPGQRGFLFNKFIYEEFIKNKTARRLDKIKERLDEGQTIAACEDCQTWIRHNINQAAYLAFQLDEDAARKVTAALRKQLRSSEPDLVALLRAFLAMDDRSFASRYELFYDVIAPHLLLYSVAIGDEFVLTAFGSGGYARKVPVKVYGTFRFRSLDRSPLAGGFNLMDIISFRDLYGYMTAERKREQDKIRRAAGVADVTRDQADAMFEEDGLVEAGQAESFDATKEVDLSLGGQRYTAAVHQRVYSKKELHDGVVLNAAVMLRDGDRLDESLAAVRGAIAKHGLPLKATAWRPASGVVGQLITVLSAVLYGAVFIIFVVALIIINNSLLMSTLERTVEIGTMRAIGAQRGFVMRMFLAETGVLAAIFGGLGAALGAALMLLLERVGIPALSDFFYFLFAGARLHPPLQGQHILLALVLIAIVALISTFYPARIATRITPRQAMASEE
jgi:ABC-type antimicrobial peptide transport system permease subunit